MRMHTVFILAALLGCGLCFGYAPDTLWTRTFGGSNYEHAMAVQQTSDGGYIIAGCTYTFGVGTPSRANFWLVKTNSDGDSLWSRVFGGSYDDVCYSVQQTSDGGYILGGWTASYGVGAPLPNYWLVKTNASGDSLWSRTYGGSYRDEGYCARQTSDGGYVFGGATWCFGAGGGNYWIVKTNSIGDSLWSKTFGGNGEDYCTVVRQTTDGGYFVSGGSDSWGTGDAWLVKTDSVGDSVWTRRFGGSSADGCYAAEQMAGGGYILGAYTSSFGSGNYDFWPIRVDAAGDSTWSRTLGGSNFDYCNSVQEAWGGGFVLLGETKSYGAGNSDVWFVKTSADGDNLWSRTSGGTAYDVATSVQKTSDGGYVLGGGTQSFGAGYEDFWLIKTEPESLCTILPAPQVVISIEGANARVSWSPVEFTMCGSPIDVTAYLMFYSPTFEGPYYYHGYASDTTYVHLGVVQFAAGQFYEVTAYTGTIGLLTSIPPMAARDEVMRLIRRDR